MTFRRVLLHGVLTASCLLAGSALSAWAGPPTVLTPPVGEKAYALAGEALADVWEKVTGQRPVVRAWGVAADAGQDSGKKSWRSPLRDGWASTTTLPMSTAQPTWKP